MKEKALQESVLQGESFHCRPAKNGPTIKVRIIPVHGERIKRLCVCEAKLPCSRCQLRNNDTDFCHYYQGDGLLGGYQIVGPRTYKNTLMDGSTRYYIQLNLNSSNLPK